jgi:hypothetical protein
MAQHNVDAIDLFAFTRPFGEEAGCDPVHSTETVRAEQAASTVRQPLHQLKENR